MLINILFVLLGIAIVLLGADRLTEGAVGLARRMKISQIVIGLTIVAMGTSMPEFCVSLVSALKGTPDLAVGNVVGSNIFNTLCIVGVAAMVAPMTVLPTTVKKDIPFAVFASLVLLVMCLDGDISRLDAGVLFVCFCAFMFFTLRGAKEKDNEEEQLAPQPVWKSVFWLVLGLIALIGGSNLFVENATQLALQLGVSEAVVGLTIVACGTSLPELATSVVSARKGQSGIAIGNVLGSNVFNILFILGATGLIQPMKLQGITVIDMSVMAGSMLLLWAFSRTKYTLARWEGMVLAVVFVGYIVYLIQGVSAGQ